MIERDRKKIKLPGIDLPARRLFYDSIAPGVLDHTSVRSGMIYGSVNLNHRGWVQGFFLVFSIQLLNRQISETLGPFDRTSLASGSGLAFSVAKHFQGPP